MKRILIAVLAFAVTLPVAADDASQYIVVLRDEKARAAVAAELRSLGARIDAELPQRIVITASATVADSARQSSAVRYVQQAVAGPADIVMEPERPARVAAATMTVQADSIQTWTTGDYAYDGSGNITAIGTAAAPGSRGTRTYTYDVVSRLENLQVSGSYPNWPYGYTYDLYGNRTAEIINGQATPVSVDSAKNRLVEATYDERGNQVARGLTRATFDGFDMITRYQFDYLNSLSYVYNASDERIGVLRGTEWTWSLRGPDGKVLRQYASSSTARTAPWLWIEDYVYRDGLLLGAERVPEEGGRRHFHLDHLGSARLVTSASGALVSEHEFLPFGAERTPMRQHIDRGYDREEPLRFTGHERDFDIARAAPTSATVDYMHARYYVANAGRFLSVDPGKDWEAAAPQSWNMYVYVRNKPVALIDPDGRRSDSPANHCRGVTTGACGRANRNWATPSDGKFQAMIAHVSVALFSGMANPLGFAKGGSTAFLVTASAESKKEDATPKKVLAKAFDKGLTGGILGAFFSVPPPLQPHASPSASVGDWVAGVGVGTGEVTLPTPTADFILGDEAADDKAPAKQPSEPENQDDVKRHKHDQRPPGTSQ